MTQSQLDTLRKEIEEKLTPIVDRDYVFLDLPFHPNVGDTLIAMGSLSFLKGTGHKCLYYCSPGTFDNRKISPDALIIFNGGGNFGDLWKEFYTDFRNKILKMYPNHHYLVLPQSVCYKEEENLRYDVELFSSCPNVTICARDKVSYDFLKEHFKENTILLVPDMAFYTEKKYLTSKDNKGKVLFLKRKDKEFVSNPKYDIVPKDAEERDWPTMERLSRVHRYYLVINRRINKRGCPKLLFNIENHIWMKLILPIYLNSGIKFVNNYDIVYTTRLHVAVLATLLNKKVVFFDNSYGKNSALYETWLKNNDNIQFIY